MVDTVQRDDASIFVDLLLPRVLGERMIPLDDIERAERTLRWAAIFLAVFSLILGVYGTLLAGRESNSAFLGLLTVFGVAFLLLFWRFLHEGMAERDRARSVAMVEYRRSEGPFSRMLIETTREMRRLGDGDEEVGFLRYAMRVLGEYVFRNGAALSHDDFRQKVRDLYPFYDNNGVDDILRVGLRIGLLQENGQRLLSMNPTFNPEEFRRRDFRPK